MPTTSEQIDQWRSVPRESPHLEFKEAKADFDKLKLYRYCVAIANEGGGKLVLGISDEPPRSVVGTTAFPSPQAIAEQIFNALKFRVDAEAVAHSEGRIVIFHIPSRPKGTAYSHQGAYLMRSGENLVSMSEDRLRAIFAEGQPDWLNEVSKHDCSSDDIIRLLDTQSYYDLQEKVYPSTREEVLRKFAQERFIQETPQGWQINRIGGLLFCKRI